MREPLGNSEVKSSAQRHSISVPASGGIIMGISKNIIIQLDFCIENSDRLLLQT